MTFASYNLHPALLQALQNKAYTQPTPIQQSAIPQALAGKDVLASAQTGSGKTAAFAIPILQQLATQTLRSPRRTLALVLVPTRELAMQVGEVFKQLAAHLPQTVQITTLFGGVSINPQMMRLRGGADVVVATPGRLLDLIDRNALHISHIDTLVLDEADRLLDMGFAAEIERILSLIPAKRQNLFFSATFPSAVQRLARALLHEPVRIDVQPSIQQLTDIGQRAVLVDEPKRTQLLRHLIEQNKWTRILVFVATKHAADKVAAKLRKARINAEPFHGEQSQGKRVQVLADFKAARLTVVVATDVAARGLDIAQLPVVVNFDLPRSAALYTHRIGRTGRAGEQGLAVSFVSHNTQAHWQLIQKRQDIDVPLDIALGFEPQDAPLEVNFSNGGIKGKRPSKKDKLRAAAQSTETPAPVSL
ncbi:MAG: DEAD/DEAH box helicase [Cytophagales bacterium]|nr:DEAD/DEAH box helicase [Cytophagales bacterium]